MVPRTTEAETEALNREVIIPFLSLIARSSFAAEDVEYACQSSVAFFTEDGESDLSSTALLPSLRTLWDPSVAGEALLAARQAERMSLEDEARLWYYHAAVAGHSSAYRPLAVMLECAGQFEAARQWYHVGAEAGDVASALRLAVDYQLCGFRQLGASMLELASRGLSTLASKTLADQGDSLEAALSDALKEGKQPAMGDLFELGSLLFLTGRTEDAVRVYQLAAKSGSALAAICLERLAAIQPERFLAAVSTDHSGTRLPATGEGQYAMYHSQTRLPRHGLRIAGRRSLSGGRRGDF